MDGIPRASTCNIIIELNSSGGELKTLGRELLTGYLLLFAAVAVFVLL